MRIALIHLSDVHLINGNNVVVRRALAIGNAARAAAANATHCFLLVSGDIAYSGRTVEYEIASKFLDNILESLQCDGADVTVALVPGNHDCDFEVGSRLRPLILDNKSEVFGAALDQETIKACTSVQRAFFEFRNRRHIPEVVEVDRLMSYSVRKDIDGQRILINCYNTAWVSRREERPGDLCFPVPPDREINDQTPTLVVSMFHHPYPWLAPDNRSAFLTFMETTSDIVLTGHEHEGGHYEVYRPGPNREVHYIEGAVLQDSLDPKNSAFHVVMVDLDASSYAVTQYCWDGDQYCIRSTTAPTPFIRNRARLRSRFDISAEFHRILDDPGRDLHHSRKRNLELHDLFVYPQLRERSMNAQLAASRGKVPLIDSAAVLDHVVRSERVLILAPGDAGKTSLCRMLFRDLRIQKDLVPILLDGNDIMGCQYDSVISAVKRAFSRQYRPEEFEGYRQLAKKERALIIDDFHKYRLNARAKATLIRAASSFFGVIVLVGDEILQYEELANQEDKGTTPYIDFSRCQVQPFGFKLREKIIRRWVELGREYTIEQAEIDFEVRQWELVVNTLLGANVIPAYPLTLLVMLQTGQAAQNHTLASGAYGYVYEALITRSIASVGEEATDTDTKYAFLSWLAYKWFREEKTSTPETELMANTRAYLDQIDLDLAAERLIGELLQSEVLEHTGADIKFRYPYYLSYFTARYLRDALTSGSDVLGVRATLKTLADNLYYQPYANILVIYLYLNRDTELIEYVLDQAKSILHEYRSCDLEADVEFLNRLDPSSELRSLPGAKPTENRDRYLDEVDAAGGDTPMFTALPEKIQYADTGLVPNFETNS